MKDYGESEEVQKTSKMNSGLLQIQRLDVLWKDCHKFARSGKYLQWNDTLDRIWCELGGDVKEKAPEITSFNELNEKFAKSCRDVPEASGFEKLSNNDKLFLIKQKTALINKELFLRRLQNAQGKGTAYEEDEDQWE